MKKAVNTILTAALAMTLGACSASGTSSAKKDSSSAEKTTYKVAVVKQLDHASLDEIADAITAELDKLAEENNVTIEYGEVYSGQNDPTTLKQIGDTVVSEDVDCIIPIATLAAQTMVVCDEEKQIPIIFAAISDPETADLTGIEYVSGTSDALNTKQIMDMMLAQNKDLKKVGLLYSKSEPNSEKSIAEAKAYLDEKKIEYVEATANTNDEVIAGASSLVAAGVEAVFTPTDNVIMAAEPAIADIFADAFIPHYTGADSFVKAGAYVTCGVNYTDLGTKTADMAFEAMTKGMNGMPDYNLMDGGVITVNTETEAKILMDSSKQFDSAALKEFGTLVEVTTDAE